MGADSILSLAGITKSYPGVIALDNVSLDFVEGEIHAIAGENGAGKSTLIKILTGAIQPDSGSIILDDQSYSGFTPHQALFDLRIAAIYQEFNLVPSLTVAQNIFLGKEYRNGPFLDIKRMNAEAARLLTSLGIAIRPETVVRDLGVAYQQIVEIAKAVSNQTRFLIMDEPTAPLTITEVDILIETVRTLKRSGVTIVYISHRMSENFDLADRITVLRDGKYISTLDAKSTSRRELFSLMVGREVGQSYPEHDRSSVDAADVVLEVRDLYSQDYLREISFTLRRGEILGFGGLVGAGRTELAMALFGAESIDHGEVIVNGETVEIRSTADAITHGIAYIPEDRKNHGILGGLSVKENISYSALDTLSHFFFIDRKEQQDLATRYVNRLRIKTPSLDQRTQHLSGGNQQKVVLSKWLATDSQVILFDEPTRGIDVGAKQEIYHLIIELAKSGKGIVLISSEMPELIGMSDRIMIMREGTIVGSFDKEHATPEAILELAAKE